MRRVILEVVRVLFFGIFKFFHQLRNGAILEVEQPFDPSFQVLDVDIKNYIRNMSQFRSRYGLPLRSLSSPGILLDGEFGASFD